MLQYPHKIWQFFYGNPAGKYYGFGGGFLWVRLWEMKFLDILVLAIKKKKDVKYYGFP
jgi:hypothetical protein